MSKSLIVNIGLPKTGTSSLQKNLFPLLCNENNILFNFIKTHTRLIEKSENPNVNKKFLA